MGSSAQKRIGLALGGGVVRGMAHLGVLLVLEREDIPIDCIAGASAGALIGALYCAGLTSIRILDLAASVGWRRIARLAWPRQGFVNFDRMERWIVQTIGDRQFRDLEVPFAAIATDIQTGLPVTLREGRLAPSVCASCAVPGFVVPVRVEGRLLGDGGVSCNLPVAAARELGAEIVIGVDLMQPAIRKRWGPIGYGLAALESLVRRSGGGWEAADCVITPELAGMTYLRFGKARQLIEIGMRAAEAALPAIQAMLNEDRVEG